MCIQFFYFYAQKHTSWNMLKLLQYWPPNAHPFVPCPHLHVCGAFKQNWPCCANFKRKHIHKWPNGGEIKVDCRVLSINKFLQFKPATRYTFTYVRLKDESNHFWLPQGHCIEFLLYCMEKEQNNNNKLLYLLWPLSGKLLGKNELLEFKRS